MHQNLLRYSGRSAEVDGPSKFLLRVLHVLFSDSPNFPKFPQKYGKAFRALFSEILGNFGKMF